MALSLGATANPITVLTPAQHSTLLTCGPLDIGLLNGVLKLIADTVDGSGGTGGSYDAGTNALTLTFASAPAVVINLAPLVADAIASGRMSSSSYMPATNMLTLGFTDGQSFDVDLTAVIADVVAGVAAVPSGNIMWRGDNVIPVGWTLCDGTLGTPDLRDRFVISAGPLNAVGTSGGALSHAHGGTTGAHTLTIAQMPAHVHGNGIVDDIPGTTFARGSQPPPGGSSSLDTGGGAPVGEGLTESIGGGVAHDHTIANASNVPPFYSLIAIMKL